MVPVNRIPKTPEEISSFAGDEAALLCAIVIIASRHDMGKGMRIVHDKSWAVMRVSRAVSVTRLQVLTSHSSLIYQQYLSDVSCIGLTPTVGLVEGLLLLAENLPRDPDLAGKLAKQRTDNKEGMHGSENRQAWMLTGMAIRLAYGMGLDQVSSWLIG